MREFDDSLLDNPLVWRQDSHLDFLARQGARIRTIDASSCSLVARTLDRPRAIVAMGAGARTVKTLIEPACPVPFVACPTPDTPPWLSAMDLVIAFPGTNETMNSAIASANRRGAQVVVIAPTGSPGLELASTSTGVVTSEDDPFVAAIVGMRILDMAGLGLTVILDDIADAVDESAVSLGPSRPLGDNAAKELACALADTVPLVWGGSSATIDAAHFIADAMMVATSRPALVADTTALAALIKGVETADMFADPVEERGRAVSFSILILDDGRGRSCEDAIVRMARSRRQRVESIVCADGAPVVRYARILQQGLYAASYLELASVER